MQIPNLFLKSAKKCGYDVKLMQTSGISHLYIESNKILSLQGNPGLIIKTKRLSQGVAIKILVKKNVKIKNPVFLCFGILNPKGKQIILPEIILEKNSELKILAHCTFPQATKVIHKMKAKIELKKASKLFYTETHYHGENFGAEVVPNFKILLRQNTYLENKFILKQGSIGKLKINLEAILEKNSFAEIDSQIIGKGREDDVSIFDKLLLEGENSHSLIKLKGAAINGGKILFKGETRASELAKNSRGHIDCQEIIIGKNSFAQSIPIISVENPEARITHEASIGKVNQKQLETLMARGLSEKQAISFIVRGVVK